MKRFLSMSVLLQAVTGLMTSALVTVFAIYAANALQTQQQARRVPMMVDLSNDLFTAVQYLRSERGNANTALLTSPVVANETRNEIATLRARSGKALDSALRRLGAIRLSGTEPEITQLREKRAAYEEVHGDVEAALAMPQGQRAQGLSDKWIDANVKLRDAIERLSMRFEDELSQADPFVAKMVRVKQMAWSVRTDAGRDRIRIAEAIASRQRITEEQRRGFADLAGRIDGAWKLVMDLTALAATTPPELKEAAAEAERLYFSEFRTMRNAVIEELAAGKRIALSPTEWVTAALPPQQSIFTVGTVALDIARGYGLRQLAAAERRFYAAVMFMVLFSTIGLITSCYVFKGVVRPLTKITETMRSVSDGNLTCAIPYENRVDEIGMLAHGLGVFRDNIIETQRLRLEKAGAEAASRAKSEFLASMSHELRTPLNAVIGFSEVIKSQVFGPVEARYRDYAGDIFNSGTLLLGLINEILDLAKLEAGRLELQEENLDLAATVEDCIEIAKTQARASKIRISSSCDSSVPAIRADDRRLRQILNNLLSNAVKFTPEGGRVFVSSARKSGHFAITVSDTGIGMAPGDISKAIATFGQVDSKVSRKHQGAGLGLPLAKQLAELHGGTLNIESEVNVGTTVTILLPLHRIVRAPSRLTAA